MLQSVSTLALPYEAVNPIALSEDESSVAHSCPINYGLLSDGLQRLAAQVEHVVVEGTGGWRSLMNDLRPLSEWVVQEQLPVLMVVGIQEGCINHALLTAQAIANDGLPLIGWVTIGSTPVWRTTPKSSMSSAKLPAPLIGELPYLPRAEQRELSRYVDLRHARQRDGDRSNPGVTSATAQTTRRRLSAGRAAAYTARSSRKSSGLT